jgi:hypothetical protein
VNAFHAFIKRNVSTNAVNNTKELDSHGRPVFCIFYCENPVSHKHAVTQGIMQMKILGSYMEQTGVAV